jgi:hypothetical protein
MFCRTFALLSLAFGPLMAHGAALAGPERGLIGYWKLNEVSGETAKDGSGGAADCAFAGTAPTPWAGGKFGRALEFYGRHGYLQAEDPAKLNLSGAFTISFWMDPFDWSSRYSPGVVSKRKSDAEHGYVIYGDGSQPTKLTIRVSGSDGACGMISASDVDEDIWQCWVLTYDPETKRLALYKNGKVDKVVPSVRLGDMSNDADFRIGYAQPWNGSFSGRINEVKEFKRALSADEVAAEFAAHRSIIEARPELAAITPKWRVVATSYATSDCVVAGCTVQEAGAKGDGKTDDTAAFERAMNSMALAGGGAVFVPEGRYVIKGNLKVPTGVTLRGDREEPKARKVLAGTILMAYADRGHVKGRPFLGLCKNSGVMNLSIWYPEQEASAIVPYPFCIEQFGESHATVENVTLVNPYQGILIPHGSELHYVHNVQGSPLALGLDVDFVSDSGRVDNVHFGPDVWSNSGLPGAPAANGPHAAWMRANGTGLLYVRYEWIYSAFVSVTGYKIGLDVYRSPVEGETSGEVYDYRITDCRTAVRIDQANFAGTSFTNCTLEGSDYGLVTTPKFNTRLLFHSCAIKGGKEAALLDGVKDQTVLFQGCTFGGMVDRVSGDLSLLDCTINADGDHVRLGKDVGAVTIAGTVTNGPARIVNESNSPRVKITQERAPEMAAPKFPKLEDKVCKPGKSNLYVVTDPEWGAKKDGVSDDTGAIQKALIAAARNGGGIVFLPGGEYSMGGDLVIPPGVELRGVYDVPHHTSGRGSVLYVHAGRNEPTAAPFIIMKERSGLRGVTFDYPEEKIDDVVPYPFMVQGRGADIYVANICVVNAYNMLDFASYKCDRHYINYPAGVALRTGIAIGGGSVEGELIDAHLQTHYWSRSQLTPDVNAVLVKGDRNLVWEYQHEHLEGFVIGDCKDELQYQTTIFGSQIGLHFISQNGKGATGCKVLAHGTDGSQISAAFDGVGPGGVDITNSQLVSMPSSAPKESTDRMFIQCGEQLKSAVRLHNSTIFGRPVTSSATVKGGTLMLDLAAVWGYEPFRVAGGGRLVLNNVYLGRPLTTEPEIRVQDSGRMSLFGIVSPLGLRLDRESPPDAVTAKFNTQQNAPIP